jgi:hypothetical protein
LDRHWQSRCASTAKLVSWNGCVSGNAVMYAVRRHVAAYMREYFRAFQKRRVTFSITFS